MTFAWSFSTKNFFDQRRKNSVLFERLKFHCGLSNLFSLQNILILFLSSKVNVSENHGGQGIARIRYVAILVKILAMLSGPIVVFFQEIESEFLDVWLVLLHAKKFSLSGAAAADKFSSLRAAEVSLLTNLYSLLNILTLGLSYNVFANSKSWASEDCKDTCRIASKMDS